MKNEQTFLNGMSQLKDWFQVGSMLTLESHSGNDNDNSNSSEHLHSTYSVPGTVPFSFNMLFI